MPEKSKKNKKSKSSAKRKRKRTFKESKFLKNLFKTGNKRNSAKKAYNIGGKGGSKTEVQANNTADRIGQKVTSKLQPDIDKYYKKQNITVDWVLKRLVGKADLSKKEIIQLKALELIGKHKKMFTDKIKLDANVEQKVKIYIPDNKRDKVKKDG